jgi:acyl-CoA thioesterase-1
MPSYGTPTLLVLGDSLSAAYQIPPEDGWVKLLENKLKNSYPQATVINSSIVGDTTANGLQRLPSLLEKYHPQILIVELGGNDGLRGISVENIKANLDAIITQSLQEKVKVLLVGIKLPPNYGPTYTKAFYEIYTQLQEKHHIPLVPFLLENVVYSPKLMFEDHIHPTSQAQPILLDNVWPYLNPLLSEAST